MPKSNPFFEYVRCLEGKGVVSGFPDGTFRTPASITRGQISKIVSNAAGFQEDPGSQIYSDVPHAYTFYAFINRLAHRGIMSGYPCPTRPESPSDTPCTPQNPLLFRPEANATRGQMAKIVSNAAGYNEEPVEQTYADVPPGSPFYLWVQRLANRGAIGGYMCGGPDEQCDALNRPYYRPTVEVTRGQASKIAANTFFPNCDGVASRK